jgi:hypothetical protein
LKGRVKKKGNVVAFDEAQRLIKEILGVDPREWGSARDFVFELIDYPLARDARGRSRPFVLPRSTARPAVGRALQHIRRLLRVEVPAGLTKAQLMQRLRAGGETSQTVKIVSTLVDSMDDLERSGAMQRLKVPIGRLHRVADQLERLLREKGRPTHARELSEAISKWPGKPGSRRAATNLRSIMSHDPRFRPMGRSGVWTLADWKFERGTVADFAARILSKSKRPMTECELYPKIHAIRPVAERSLLSLLREDGRFRRVAPRTWELKRK